MLANHFYDPISITKLTTFFGSVHRLVIVCDPPFGVFIEALTNSIEKLREQFFTSSTGKLNNVGARILLFFQFSLEDVFLKLQ
ncbi:hypothetical protein WUBG_19252 [Wuchereria bancrofti]|uniref:Uncharacterized protein n=1 Tax=Wuchereria bancrofti TaxID=6293 RepID=J9A7E5_WUCBA|nr:hypothetical protein WUBG_19252 [Wuchereria bancrofti]